MRSSLILASLIAPLALAKPLQKRHLTTEVEVVTVYTTVTRGASPTSEVSSPKPKIKEEGYPYGGEWPAPPAGLPVPESPSSPEGLPAPESPAPKDKEEGYPYGEEVPAPPAGLPVPESPAPPSEPVPEPITPPSEPVPEPITPPSESVPEAVTPSSEDVPAQAPAASPSQAPASPQAPGPAPGSGSSVCEQAAYQHNILRAKHADTGPVTCSEKLSATAAKLANSCRGGHNTEIDRGQYEGGYGQNVGSGYRDITSFISGMYNGEVGNYDGAYGQANPTGARGTTGHFTAIVWKSTKEVGCAIADCGGSSNLVCNYYPVGNFGGRYGDNVGRPL